MDKPNHSNEQEYKVEIVSLPMNVMFQPEYSGDVRILKVNENHAFYKKVLLPLACDWDEAGRALTDQELEMNRKAQDGLLIMLMCFCDVVHTSDNPDLLHRFVEAWSRTYGVALDYT